jgi:signal transduction histidine kinase
MNATHYQLISLKTVQVLIMSHLKRFLELFEPQIIGSWRVKTAKAYPAECCLFEADLDGIHYFKLLTDIDIPLDEHPSFQHLSGMCRRLFDEQVPLNRLLQSTHFWREALMEYMIEFCKQSNLTVSDMGEFVPPLHVRIDTVQRYMCDFYGDRSVSVLENKIQALSWLHDDRLSMLGKMAASMAHEIRNPLTAIEGFIQLIRIEMNNPTFLNLSKINGFLDIIQSEFHGLYGQITSFLSFSKNDGFEEPYISCTIKEMIESVLELANPRLISYP